MEGSQQHQYNQGGYDGRGDGKERVDEQYQPQHQQTSQPPQQSYPAPPAPSSPPPSASPFAFAPPPLSSNQQNTSRPPMPFHHSDPTPQQPTYQYYDHKPPQPQHHNSYPSYPGSAPLGYRSFSGESSRQSPSQAHMPRPGDPSGASPSFAPLPSPAGNGPYAYQRQPSYSGAPVPLSPHQSQSPQRVNMYPPNYYSSPYGQPPPGAADMPRSLSYPSAHPHPSYPPYIPAMPHQSHPPYQAHQPGPPPPLNRHSTTSNISSGVAGMSLARPNPSLGYSFSNRLPLVDRPFKCDECVQSFNRNHDLKRHKRIHLSVKPFGCDKCGKTFSRKDALRRHWLVKGCRGEDGATAPIVPLFPINSTPALSPPSPNSSPVEQHPPPFPSTGSGFNHPSAPPPLSSLPARQSSGISQMIVTPDDPEQESKREVGVAPPLEEPIPIDPAFSHMNPGSGSGSGGSNGDGYFEGVVGIKSDGTAVLEKAPSNTSYGRMNEPPISMPHNHYHHPYRRTQNMSPHHSNSSPSASQYPHGRSYTPSNLGPNDKPVFAMPFAQQNYGQMPHDGMLAPPFENGIKMEKQASQMSQASVEADYHAVAPRWHRPSFPFPPPASGNIYNPNYDSTSPIDQTGPQQHVMTQGYSQ